MKTDRKRCVHGDPAPQTPAATPTGGSRLTIDVEWADITKARGDVFVVGHYIGVLPQNAELALDITLSGTSDRPRLVLTDLTRRGAIRGALGDVYFFPRRDGSQVVLAGMGRPGLFGEAQLRKLARSLTETVGRLMTDPTICTVLIGSGAGNLEVRESVAGLLAGAAEALAVDPSLTLGRLRIVERNLDRAYEILATLNEQKVRFERDHGFAIDVAPEVVERDEAGGVIPIPFGFSLMLASLAQACYEGSKSRLHATAEALVAELPEGLREQVRADLKKHGSEKNLRRVGLKFRVSQEPSLRTGEIPDRVSFSQDGTTVRTAAITNTATVTERALGMQFSWIERIVDDLYAATPEDVDAHAVKAFNHLVHPDIRGKIADEGPLVIEVDRTLARVPWEMIHDDDPGRLPLAIYRPVARQLRTTYSPRAASTVARPRLKALVIGDPDDSLPYALAEAQAVADVLQNCGVEVVLRLGAPDDAHDGRHGVEPADLFDVVTQLQAGAFDLVHYAGHAVFDPEYPEQSGWRFSRGEVFTPSKLENVEQAPRLVVANACISAGLASTPGGTEGARPGTRDGARGSAGDARLVASLADEFFRRGVADYIGTAWEVPDLPAMLFATRFYESLLAPSSAGRATLGKAAQQARTAVYERRAEWGERGTVWAAYQHYGDPTRTLMD